MNLPRLAATAAATLAVLAVPALTALAGPDPIAPHDGPARLAVTWDGLAPVPSPSGERLITACTSDGPGDAEAPCYWNAETMGNGVGRDFILWIDGAVYYPELVTP